MVELRLKIKLDIKSKIKQTAFLFFCKYNQKKILKVYIIFAKKFFHGY